MLSKKITEMIFLKRPGQHTPDKCLTLSQTLQNEGKGKTADEVYSLLSIIFKGAIAYGILQKSPLAIIQIQKHVNLEFLLNSFPLNSEDRNPYLDTLHQTIITNCLMMFIHSTKSLPKPPAWLVEIADRVMLDEYLQNNVGYFLKDIHYSKRHVCRSFQKYYGMSPSEYLTKAKIIQSTNYLMEKNMLIVNIAQQLGFSTQSGFIKAFKAYFNISPNAWRKQYLSDKHLTATSKFGEAEEL